jgi:diaminohydroxyphosphoribosylaminopyrimidine deaminase/5-amino-6-(5-phosphoribosylamino)uracil reductase
MRRALALARNRLGFTTPNPSVGCVIVRGGRIVGRGATGVGGRPHAETVAIAGAAREVRGATAYVTLEPCAHTGKTGPCAKALVDAGVARVVVGCLDPYPAVRGRGIAILRKAGIMVDVGVLEDECRTVNEGFFTRVTRRRPFGILKLATSLDGRIAAASGDSQWISSEESRTMVHRWRCECDAVVVGAGTVIADDPRLTCRLPHGRDPMRVIVDERLRTSPKAQVFVEDSTATAILVTSHRNLERARRRYAGPRTEVIAIPDENGKIDFRAMMLEFGRRGWCRVLFEGGAHMAGFALSCGVVDRVAFFVAPKIVGAGLPAIEGMATPQIRNSLSLEDLSVRRIGSDLLIEGRPLRRAALVTKKLR